MHLPQDEDILGVLRRRGCMSLRALCAELWPDLRWRALFAGEACVVEEDLAETGGISRALWVWQVLGRLVALGKIQVAGHDPDEVDSLAAVAFELRGQRYRRVMA